LRPGSDPEAPAGSCPAASRARIASGEDIRFSAVGGKPILTAILRGKAQDALVVGDEWARQLDRAGNQEPIGGIAVLELIGAIASRGSDGKIKLDPPGIRKQFTR